MQKLIDLTGKHFDRLTVIKRVDDYVSPKGYKEPQWLCKCDCGNESEIIATGKNLRRGRIKSCGCLKRESSSKTHKKYNSYDLSGEYGIGYTLKGEEFYFDLEDYDLIKDYCWFKDKDDYIIANSNKTCSMIRLHRLVTNCPDNLMPDHINGRQTRNDNRKSNLRVCTNQENSMNAGISQKNTSGIVGVSWDKARNKWSAYICYNSKNIHLGRHNNFEDAIKARLVAEDKYFGEFSPQKHLFKQYGVE